MKKLKERIFGNWRTSICGVFLMISCLLLVAFSKAAFIDVTPILIISLGLLGFKDPQNIGK